MSKYHRAVAGIDAAPTVESEPPVDIVTTEDAKRIGEQIGIDWSASEFPVEEFAAGLVVEREHGPNGPGGDRADVSRGDPLVEGKIAWAHLLELPDYYTRLEKMEGEGEAGDEVAGASTDPADYQRVEETGIAPTETELG